MIHHAALPLSNNVGAARSVPSAVGLLVAAEPRSALRFSAKLPGRGSRVRLAAAAPKC